jgi:hypothetical protein
MTNIERLRNLPAKWREQARKESAAFWICATELEEALVALADYERLRGMEERVKGLSAAWMNQAKRMDTTQSFLEGRAHSLEDCAEDLVESLVPVPGGE